jgi:hypothetical protein
VGFCHNCHTIFPATRGPAATNRCHKIPLEGRSKEKPLISQGFLRLPVITPVTSRVCWVKAGPISLHGDTLYASEYRLPFSPPPNGVRLSLPAFTSIERVLSALPLLPSPIQ